MRILLCVLALSLLSACVVYPDHGYGHGYGYYDHGGHDWHGHRDRDRDYR
jgi:hypothetical protein